MEKGYITLPRSFFHSEEWLHPRVFSKAEAWLDILASVRFSSQPTTITIAGKTVPCATPCVTPHATPRETPHTASSAISPPFGATAFATPSATHSVPHSVSLSVSPSVTKQNKRKEERININDPTTRVRVRDEVFDLSLNRLWCEAVCMRHPTWRSSTRSSLLSTISCRSSHRAREIKSPYSKEQETNWFPAPY